jgi:hypothetical protein
MPRLGVFFELRRASCPTVTGVCLSIRREIGGKVAIQTPFWPDLALTAAGKLAQFRATREAIPLKLRFH